MSIFPISRFLQGLLGRELDPLMERNRLYSRSLDQGLPVARYDFVSVDTELTGLDSRRDEIVSIGAVRIRNLRICLTECFHAYVKPEKPLPKDSTLIHRITPGQIKNAPFLAEVLPSFVDFCGDSLLVGHYIGLDMGFINRACVRLFGSPMANPCIDTMRLAQVYKEEQWENYYDQFNLQISYNLTDLAREYNIPVFPSHDALQDAIQAAYLFLFLIKKLRNGDITTLKDLYMAGRSWRWLF